MVAEYRTLVMLIETVAGAESHRSRYAGSRNAEKSAGS